MQNRRWLASGLFLLASIALSKNVLAVPAAPIVHELIQPDGSRFQAKKWGDEWNHGWETVEGYTIVQEAATKSWVYAASDADGKMVPTARAVGADAVPLNTPKYLRPAGKSSSKALQMSAGRNLLASAAVAPTGTAKIPVILVNFSDTSTTYAANDFSSLLFGTGNHSMKDYYEEVSYGKFSVSSGSAGVRGWYKASKTHDYYGDTYPHSAELVREAVAAADADINFSQYDSDGDCYVDVVAIVHQGTGEEASKTATDIWSHRWDLYSAGVGEYTTNDTAACGSIKVKDYIIQPELYDGGLTTMGVFAHEYGHSIGLPDLYDTDDTSAGIGNWCLMAGGNWNQVSRGGDRPAHLSAWGKYKLGWVNPTVVIGKLENEQISAASSQADVYRLLVGSPRTGGEYFLIENRQRSGFDEGLPGSGLAIWHIDESKETSDNKDNTQECKTATGCLAAHYRVALEQADGLFQLENNTNRGNAGDLYISGKNFTSSTVPNSLLYSGTDHKLSVTNISASQAVMTATLDASSYYYSGRLSTTFVSNFFIRDDGSLWAWGGNYYGQIGDGTTEDKHSPVRIGTATDWQTVATGDNHTLAVKKDGSLWAWGWNSRGQLGDGTTEDKHSPVRIGTATDWQTVATGDNHTLAVKKDGSLWAWGWNSRGQLGDGTTEDKHSPAQTGAPGEYRAVEANSNHGSFALKNVGSLWAWGNNENGQLGLGDGTGEEHSPIRVPTDIAWRTVTADFFHTVAIKSNGSLWAWGWNGMGRLGDGTTDEKLSPVQIGTATDWQAVSAGGYHTVAMKNDGSLWAWGENSVGQLGDGTTRYKLSPVRIGTATDWQAVSAGFVNTVAMKSDGSLWAWGENNCGQLGDGTTIDRHTPVRVIFSTNSDTDNDGIDDGWERTYFGNLTTANATSDYDKDGYSDKQEYLNWQSHETASDGEVYDPTAKNLPGGTGYVTPVPIALPAIYKLLLKR